MINRRIFTTALAAGLLSVPALARAGLAPVRVQVFHAPECGCCGPWARHLQQQGFLVEMMVTADMQFVKDRHAVPMPLRSCHTALIDDYVIEGHVPAADIRTLLDQRPQATGLAVPGMPIGSPGMEMGAQRDPYDVILWTGSQNRVFSSYEGKA